MTTKFGHDGRGNFYGEKLILANDNTKVKDFSKILTDASPLNVDNLNATTFGKDFLKTADAIDGRIKLGITDDMLKPGVDGKDGKDGAKGADGLPGPQGPKGDPGADGAVGPKGADGADGVEGPRGLPGPQGPKGDTGLQGVAGAKGDKGDKGLPGATGPQGPKGDQGLRGATGATGSQGAPGLPGKDGDPSKMTDAQLKTLKIKLEAIDPVVWRYKEMLEQQTVGAGGFRVGQSNFYLSFDNNIVQNQTVLVCCNQYITGVGANMYDVRWNVQKRFGGIDASYKELVRPPASNAVSMNLIAFTHGDKCVMEVIDRSTQQIWTIDMMWHPIANGNCWMFATTSKLGV